MVKHADKKMTINIGITVNKEQSYKLNLAMEAPGETYSSVSHYFRVLMERDYARKVAEGKIQPLTV